MKRLKSIYKDLFENPLGRISRGDFWIVYFFQFFTYLTIIFLFGENSWIVLVSALLVTVSSPLFQIKRYHDSGHKGWWILVPIANLIFLFYNSTEDNKWGSKLN